MFNIREYKPEDERSWLECRVLSFLDSAYYDDVIQHKESYSNPVIDLVAECDDKIVGFIECLTSTIISPQRQLLFPFYYQQAGVSGRSP